MLDEFAALSGYHRKHAIRLLGQNMEHGGRGAALKERVYDEAVKEALVVIWEAADRICGKRLKAAIPTLIAAMERHGHLQLEPTLRDKLLSVSAATIDRVLAGVRQAPGSQRKRKVSRKVCTAIAVKTYHDWEHALPGHLEIDFVVHGGGSMSGEYLHSLVATDVYSGWTEAVPLLAREQSLVVEGLRRIREQLPVPLLGIDSDNDGAFINETLTAFCKEEGIVFTRSRPYRKNDQAWIEQKNGAVVRRMVGHARFAGIIAGQAMAQLFQVMRLYVNFCLPSFKLRERRREGSAVRKVYYRPATPCERLVTYTQTPEVIRQSLRSQRDALDPIVLLQRIRQGQTALASLSAGTLGAGPERASVHEFLAQLPRLWRNGEVRPTHRTAAQNSRYWRTREDPFKQVWPEILVWLQREPDATAKSLFLRLQEQHHPQFAPGQLRTLQRRIAEWRQTMARQLVFGGQATGPHIAPIGGEALRKSAGSGITCR